MAVHVLAKHISCGNGDIVDEMPFAWPISLEFHEYATEHAIPATPRVLVVDYCTQRVDDLAYALIVDLGR